MGAKIIELSNRLAGRADRAEAKPTLRQKLKDKSRAQIVDLLETAYSKYLALGESYKQLAEAYKNQQRLGITLTMHAAGAQLLDADGKLARDEVTLVIDQRVGDVLAGFRWDLTVTPAETDADHLIVTLRRQAAEPEQQAAGEG